MVWRGWCNWGPICVVVDMVLGMHIALFGSGGVNVAYIILW
jgi:hypothetical protein